MFFDILYKINQGDRSNPKKEGFLLGKGFGLKNRIQDTSKKKKKSLVFLILK